MTNDIKDNIQEWLKLNKQGLFVEAKDFYFNNLFNFIIDHFVENTPDTNRCDVLFSILGFSPEPIILTQRALAPKVHVIFTTNKEYGADEEIVSYLEKYLTSNYKIVNLKDDTFNTIYDNLLAQMNLYPSTKYVIDITGGKKSMVASAAIFAKDYNFNVVYVDYEEYVPELRRPMPGTEKLNIVYSVTENLINTLLLLTKRKDVIDNKAQPKLSSNSKSNSGTVTSQPQSIEQQATKEVENNEKLQKSFNEVFDRFTTPHVANNSWVGHGIKFTRHSRRLCVLKHLQSGLLSSFSSAQFFDFILKCKSQKRDPHKFLIETSRKADLLNPTFFALLNVISYYLFKEKFK